jgi:hypothetical protein
MRVVFVLNDGRTIEMPPEQVHLSISTDGQQTAIIHTNSVRTAQDARPVLESALHEWCEDLWKLEDKR